MDLGNKKVSKGVSDEQKANFLKVYKEYLNQSKNG